jgi:hypothetical protein
MKSKLKSPINTHINVIEELVHSEIQRQIQSYPDHLKTYINTVEVATYALNRLPAFYASSLQGREQQLKRAYKHRPQIIQEVRRALAAIQRDPLRVAQPLISERDRRLQEADEARQAILEFLQERQLINSQTISWDKLPSVLTRSFNAAKWQAWSEEFPMSPATAIAKIAYQKA